ncbi:hypothetical protein D3C77_729250 [compost metagenome]
MRYHRLWPLLHHAAHKYMPWPKILQAECDRQLVALELNYLFISFFAESILSKLLSLTSLPLHCKSAFASGSPNDCAIVQGINNG